MRPLFGHNPSKSERSQIIQFLEPNILWHVIDDRTACTEFKKPLRRIRFAIMLMRWHSECAYCQRLLLPYTTMTQVEHVFPVSKGGSNLLINRVPACADCNLRKADADGIDFLFSRFSWTPKRIAAWMRRAMWLDDIAEVFSKEIGRPSLLWEDSAQPTDLEVVVGLPPRRIDFSMTQVVEYLNMFPELDAQAA